MPETIPEAAHRLLDEPNFAHVVTLNEDGSPQVTPVWVDRDGDVVVFNTQKGRIKHLNLERDPRVALSVHDQANPYEYVQVQGRAELVEQGAREHIDAMSQKYMGRDYPFLQPGDVRIIVRVTPDKVQYAAPRG